MFIKYLPELDEIAKKKLKKVHPDKRNGKLETMYGYKIEETVYEYLTSSACEDLLNSLGLNHFEQVKDVLNKTQITKVYDSKNITFEIQTFDKGVYPIFFRSSSSEYFGAYNTTSEEFKNDFNWFCRRNDYRYFFDNRTFFDIYEQSGMTTMKIKKTNWDAWFRFKNNIFRDWEKLIQFVIQGRDYKPKNHYIMFYDKNRKMLYLSSIDEYISLLTESHVKGTFKTRMKLTRGKDEQIKFKLANPVYLLSKDRKVPFWNMNEDEKFIIRNKMRISQGKVPHKKE